MARGMSALAVLDHTKQYPEFGTWQINTKGRSCIRLYVWTCASTPLDRPSGSSEQLYSLSWRAGEACCSLPLMCPNLPLKKGQKQLSERHREMNLLFSLVLCSLVFPLVSSWLEIRGAHSHPAWELTPSSSPQPRDQHEHLAVLCGQNELLFMYKICLLGVQT